VDPVGAKRRHQRIGHLVLPDQLGKVFWPITAIQGGNHPLRIVGAADLLRGCSTGLISLSPTSEFLTKRRASARSGPCVDSFSDVGDKGRAQAKAAACRAISSSSLVGITSTETDSPSGEM